MKFLLLLGPGGTPPGPPARILGWQTWTHGARVRCWVHRPVAARQKAAGAKSSGRWANHTSKLLRGHEVAGAEPRSQNPKKVLSQLEPPRQGFFSGVFLSENG